ncbi:MAG: type I DNA topoisomerase [Bacteroidaceae bacterium]|nr:type I DNA topoisomerase [Bacteroidaceae bacterium]
MPKNLVIVESPAKAKTIEKFLGEDYKVMSSFGHIRDLKKKNFGVDLETFQPEYEIPADKTKVVSDLRAQAKKVDTVWLASDEDREGEAISWHLAEVLKLDPARAKRIVFHEITKPAILSAIENPRNIDHNLVDAQQARRVLDRLVGFKLSPVLWRKVKPNLSAGRVQSVAVRLIVEREREIENFQSEMAYRVVANFVLPQSQEGEGATVLLRAELNKAFKTEAEAKAFLESCKNTEFIVESVVKRPTKRTPAPPFTTSTLQQEASRKLGFPVATTMRVAQSLYEAGWITYMRTDSMNLSQLCLNSCGPVIKSLMGEEYHHRHTYHTQAKGAQEAHEAIRPTDMSREKIDGTPQEKRLYSLIWKRTIASQMADAKLEKTVITITVGGREEVFQATGEVLLFDGFLKVYRESRDVENENENDEALLPPLSEGDVLGYADISARQRYSRQPMRYTEASLVHKMEELGIGRPSTYAPTISTIQQRKYVEKGDREGFLRTCDVLTLAQGEISASQAEERVGAEKGKLLPTDTGTVVNDFLTDNFPEILDYNFTANVEKDFDHVAEGKKEWTSLIQQFYGDFSPSVDRAMEERTELRVGEREIGIDPESGKPVKVRIGKFGPMVQIGVAGEDDKPRFATLPANLSMNTITLEEALELFRLPRKLGEYEGELIEVNTGRFGPYVRHAGKFVSIPKGEDPLDISHERAVELIQEKRDSEEKSHLKSFDEEPEMEVRTGRYGPYIVYKGKNYRIPKNKAANAADLTLEECRKIVETPVKAKKK